MMLSVGCGALAFSATVFGFMALRPYDPDARSDSQRIGAAFMAAVAIGFLVGLLA